MTNEKTVECIDACIFLGLIVEKHGDCQRFLNNIGYKGRDIGLITHPIIGEIVTNILLKVHNKLDREEAFRLLDTILYYGIQSNKFKIAKLTQGDDLHSEDLMREYWLTEDDAKHLSNAIIHGCNSFITIDEKLTDEKVVNSIKEKYGLTIKKP
jgi:predicted nucleic acid-binding protein